MLLQYCFITGWGIFGRTTHIIECNTVLHTVREHPRVYRLGGGVRLATLSACNRTRVVRGRAIATPPPLNFRRIRIRVLLCVRVCVCARTLLCRSGMKKININYAMHVVVAFKSPKAVPRAREKQVVSKGFLKLVGNLGQTARGIKITSTIKNAKTQTQRNTLYWIHSS